MHKKSMPPLPDYLEKSVRCAEHVKYCVSIPGINVKLMRFIEVRGRFCVMANTTARCRYFYAHHIIQAGELFSSCSGMKNYIRLSFAYYDESDLHEGVARLKLLFD